LQVDLEKYFRGFGEVESIRLRRTDTGLFKGSVLTQFKESSAAENFISEPREWNGSLLETQLKTTWIQGKEEEAAKLSPEEQRAQRRARERSSAKHFSAFKQMQNLKELEESRGRKKDWGRKQGRRGQRENGHRGRSRSPAPVEDVDIESATGVKRPLSPSAGEEGASLFSPKQQKVDDTSGEKRPAEEELNGEVKKVKAYARIGGNDE
jgi:lupus La protein